MAQDTDQNDTVAADDDSRDERSDDVPFQAPVRDDVVARYRAGPQDGYNVELQFEGDWTPQEQAALLASADFISALILEDVPDVVVDGENIDDLRISVFQDDIDGTDRTLAYAEVLDVRTDSVLPATANLVFDQGDIDQLLRTGGWQGTVLHEMFHALGFGTVWEEQGLSRVTAQDGGRFTGVNATAAYKDSSSAAGDLLAMNGVPIQVEADGFAEGHWDEDRFGTEFMTPEIDDTETAADISIASLEDLGYDTAWDDVTRTDDRTGPIPIIPI